VCSPPSSDDLEPSGSVDPDEAFLCRLVNFLKKEREKQCLTLRDLEKVMGVSNGHLSRAERGLSEPGVVILRRWCRALGLEFEAVCRDAEIR
jgi:transcriptional regulator with XRE-family HTH domain